MNNCTPLWREAHFEVKMYKTHQRWTTLEVEMSKKCTPSWHEAHLERTKHTNGRQLVEVEMSKNCTHMWRKAHFQVKMCKTHQLQTLLWREARCQVKMPKAPHARTTFEGSDVVLRGRRKGLCTWPKKWAECEAFAAFPKTMAGVGRLQGICKDAFRVAGAIQETCSSEIVAVQGSDFLRGVAFWSIKSSVLGR